MPDPHTICFRRAWTLEVPPGTSAGRLDLPASRLAIREPFRILRRWSVPPRLPTGDALILELSRVPGLLTLRLDDRPIALPESGRIPLTPDRSDFHYLSLDVDPRPLDDAERTDWGHVALIVLPAE